MLLLLPLSSRRGNGGTNERKKGQFIYTPHGNRHWRLATHAQQFRRLSRGRATTHTLFSFLAAAAAAAVHIRYLGVPVCVFSPFCYSSTGKREAEKPINGLGHRLWLLFSVLWNILKKRNFTGCLSEWVSVYMPIAWHDNKRNIFWQWVSPIVCASDEAAIHAGTHIP